MHPEHHYNAGSVISRREVLHGKLWMQHPVTVVEDRGNVLAVWLEPGSRFDFHEHPMGSHPWSGADAWGGTHVLQLHRTGDLYSVWKFFADGEFTHWYSTSRHRSSGTRVGSTLTTTAFTSWSAHRDKPPGRTCPT